MKNWLQVKEKKLLPFLFSRWGLFLALWAVTQIAFIIANYKLFFKVSFSEFFNLLWGSSLFAISASLFMLTPFLVLNLLPIHFKHNRYYQIFSDFWYYAAGILFFIANGVDIVYYPITHQRMNAAIFNYVGQNPGDTLRLLPTFLVYYWYWFLIAGVCIYLFFFFGKRIKLRKDYYDKKYYVRSILTFLIMVPLVILGQRGGFQLRPLDIYNAGDYTSNNADLILNTPFVIMKSFGQTQVKEVEYFKDESAMLAAFNPYRHFEDKIYPYEDYPNVVIIILEGFSSEYSKFLTGYDKGYTPFLDSLMESSLVFRGMANARNSVTGVPAVVAGFPNWMDESYIFSLYSQNHIPSLANTLKTLGYRSSFYHGGVNGTMGFNSFAKQIGFDEYLGKQEYNNDADYDGNWGIFDEPFMQYAANRIKRDDQPFFSVIYTLSSHHPYTLPEAYQNTFDKGTLVSHESAGYTDYAVKRFFETASQKDWFDNTLFVITSDHSTVVGSAYYRSSLGVAEIPLFWYFPKHLKAERDNRIMQQIDIMPSLLHYLGYDQPFTAFGQSIFDTACSPYLMSYSGGDYMMVSDEWVLNLFGGEPTSLRKDNLNFVDNPNVIQQYPNTVIKLSQKTKAIIQQYNQKLIHNQFSD